MGDLETVSTARHRGWGPENSIMSSWMLVCTFYSLAVLRSIREQMALLFGVKMGHDGAFLNGAEVC